MPRAYFSNWLTLRRIRIHAFLLAVGIWTAFFVNLDTPGLRDHGGQIKGADFLHFYTLGTLARQDRGDLLYDIPAQTDLLQKIVPEAHHYVYLPLYGPQVSLFFEPFARLPYIPALAIWLSLNVLIYAGCCYAVWKYCSNLSQHRFTVLLAAIAFPGISQLLAWGQTSGLALLFFTLAYLALRNHRHFLAGLAIGCLVFKPQLALAAAVVFIFTKQWKIICGAVLSGFVQLAIGWLHFSSSIMRNYLDALTHTGQIISLLEPRPYQTHSLRTFWTMILPWPSIAFAFYMVSTAVILFLLIRCWKNGDELNIRFGTLLIATVLVSPHLTVYDLVILAPAFLLLTDWTLAQHTENQSFQLQLLIYSCFVLFLLGPIVRIIHVQFSVIAMTAIIFTAHRACGSSLRATSNSIAST
ncbi:MAG TPA: glycosyltransferase family 87 protein [Terriglobales bacterium]|nr:glycosyltransferase family 87 protein [Terriglobales bacterium]